MKFDGYRMQARLDHGKVKLLTRKNLDWTANFKPSPTRSRNSTPRSALIDGEMVVEENGVSDFSALQDALKHNKATASSTMCSTCCISTASTSPACR